jgi:hypothetical protein
MQSAMACTSRGWWDFVSYDPRLPENLSYFCKRFMRDDAMIALIEDAIVEFNKELADLVEKLRGYHAN